MGKRKTENRERTYGMQRSLNLKSKIFVLLRDELGLNKQPKVARLLADEIQAMVDKTIVSKDYVKPGELLLLSPEVGQGASWKYRSLKEKKLKSIKLTLIDDQDVESLCRGEAAAKVRRERMVRLVKQAYEQGATLTSSQLAMMTGVGATRVSAQLKEYMKESGEVLPTRGIIEDCSPAITHKVQIIKRHLGGETTSEISKNTNHTPKSVERYIKRFEQIRELTSYLDKDPDAAIIARILGCSEYLVEAYLELISSEEASKPSAIKKPSRKGAKNKARR